MTTKWHLGILVFPVFLVSSCGGGRPQSDPIIPIAQVPAPVMEAAKKALPGINFETVYKTKIEGKDAYEVRGKDKRGKPREAEVSPTGELLGIE